MTGSRGRLAAVTCTWLVLVAGLRSRQRPAPDPSTPDGYKTWTRLRCPHLK